MKIFDKQHKSIPGWGYWGNYGEIEIGFSTGYVGKDETFTGDKPHYHKTGVVYIFVTQGEGQMNINGEEITIKQDQLLRVDPGEIYYHTGASVTPFQWFTMCTVKAAEDKVVLDSKSH